MKTSGQAFAAWLEEIADSLEAGVVAQEAVQIAQPLPRGLSQRISERLGQGESWLEALSVLDLKEAERQILSAGSGSGKLPVFLRRIALMRRIKAKITRKIFMGVVYPLVLVHMAAVVFSVEYVIDGDWARFAVSAGLVLVPVWVLGLLGYSAVRWFPSGTRAFLRSMPIWGSYRLNWDTAVLCHVLSATLDAGWDLRNAWASALATRDDPQRRRIGKVVEQRIQNGEPLGDGLTKLKGVFPRGFAQLYRAGEMSGKLVDNLNQAAQRYQKEAEERVFLAVIVYPKFVLLFVFGLLAFKIVKFFQDYYQGILDMGT